jgi:hypothetical protein
MATIKINTCDKDWFGRDYVFYDKKGYPMNILYDEELDMYKGKLYFPENSSDTFETLEVNTFERIRGFEYQQYDEENGDELFTKKFQLFNTDGIEFIGNTFSASVTKIESVNDRSDFSSKWIYGSKIDLLFPPGTEIKFNRSIFSINNNETYTVVNTQKDAVLIITSMDNKNFTDTFGGILNDSNQYNNLSVSGVNAIKIYNYVNNDYENNFPDWSEPNFYNQLFNDQKISVVNSEINGGVYTVKNVSLGDNYYSDFRINLSDLDGNLTIRVKNKTSNFNVYKGSITFEPDYILLTDIPPLMKPNVKFQVPSSSLNNKSLTIDNISNFNNVNTIYYFDGGGTISNADQVIYENNIYHCIQSYTSSATSSITPLNTDYWTPSTFLPIKEKLVTESLTIGNIFLENNEVNLPYIYDSSLTPRVNLAKAFEEHKESLDILGATTELKPLEDFGTIKSKYPTPYLEVEYFVDKIDTFSGSTTNGTNFSPTGYTFSYDPHQTTNIVVKKDGLNVPISEDYLSSNAWVYFSDSGSASSLDFESLNSNTELYWKEINANFGLTPSNVITVEYTTEVSSKNNIIERIIEVEENLTNELREDYSYRPERRVILTDIDEFGLKITINEQVYSVDSTIIYRGNGDIDLEESIDGTLREWVTKWRIELDKRGIYVASQYFGNSPTTLVNSLFIRGFYPNVPLSISVSVGDTAEYFIPDQNIILYQSGGAGSQMTFTINGRSYIESYSSSISNTLTNWVNSYSEVLESLGIYVNSVNQVLEIKKKDDIDINVNVNVGRTFLPGEKVFEIIKYSKQNEGLILTSNSIVHFNNQISFEDECFSTGQILSINNSEWVLNNQEYNVVYLNPDKMILSYQGPFWGTLDTSVQSAFFNLSFGDDLNIGDSIMYLDSNEVLATGSITSIASNYYQVLTNNEVVIVDRNNAFGYDSGAINISINPVNIEAINIEADTGITDIDYFNLNSRISIVSDEINFLESNDLVMSSTTGLSQSVIKQVVNPINNFLFCLTQDYVYVIDPITETVHSRIDNLGTEGWDITCDYTRGDIYVSYGGIDVFDDRIMKISSDLSTSSVDYYPGYRYGKLTYNRDEDSLYVFSRQVLSISTVFKVIYKVDLTDSTQRDLDFLISNAGLGRATLPSNDGYLGGSNRNTGTIHYNEFNGSMYISNLGVLSKINTSDSTLEDTTISAETYYDVALDPFNQYLWVSNSDNKLFALDEFGDIAREVNIDTYGYILVNPMDSNIYIATQNGENRLKVFSTYADAIFYSFNLNFELDKIIYNRDRESIVGYNSSEFDIINIETTFIYTTLKGFSTAFDQSSFGTGLELSDPIAGETDSSVIGENNYGTLASDYTESEYLALKTREFIRKPRQNYETTGAPQVNWAYQWETDEVDEIFMVDISGEHLPTTGSYAYTGEKPLENPVIRRKANKDLKLVSESYAQQTIFDTLSYSLDYNDSETNISFIPEGIQTILGFNSKDEGVVNNKLNIIQTEDISITYPSYDSFTSSEFSVVLPDQVLSFSHNDETNYGEITFSGNSTDTFSQKINISDFISSNTNLDIGHNLNIRVLDNTSDDPYVSQNNHINVKIINIFERKLIVKYLDNRTFKTESTKIENYPINGVDTFLDVKIDVIPKKMVELDIYGQTEIEDIRYKTELTNTGKLINPEDIYIFKEYDLNEGGIDWNFMNSKRKEMLDVRNEIYNYLGSYRSIINAINFFGYNDLELNEYFQNINPQSPNFKKLTKVEIPDIFDNSVEGWTENYKYWQFPNKNFEETKLFNLTYRLTDFNGDKLSAYSLEETIIKLRGLKKWLENNIVPITHDILDITGRSDFRQNNQVYNTTSQVRVLNIHDEITPVDFNLNEIYVLPVQSGSTVYNNVIDFSVGETSSMVDYFELSVKTYRIYDLWDPFISYSYGDKVKYFGKIYENVLTDPTAESLGQDPTLIKNKNNNPRFYENSESWNINTIYNEGDIVEYNRKYYKYSLKTSDANYLPWDGASDICLTGTPSQTNGIDDNFYTDLIDRIGNEETIPNYWTISEDSVNSHFDVLDIVKENYSNRWCDLIDRDSTLINDIAIDMINLPEANYQGDKPTTISDATVLINNMIDDFIITKSNYKFKFRELNPRENILQENNDFILWDDITEWVEIDLEPVQYLSEYRSGEDMLLPFNFTLDTNIDPYVVIECRSDNGYGQIKNIRKSYEIRFDADSDSVLVKTIRS